MFLWFSHGFPWIFLGFPMVFTIFPWISHGFVWATRLATGPQRLQKDHVLQPLHRGALGGKTIAEMVIFGVLDVLDVFR